LARSKSPLKPKEVWAIPVRLQILKRIRDIALFNLAIDGKLHGCDLVKVRVEDIVSRGQVRNRALICQQKTGNPVQFEITDQTREAIGAWRSIANLKTGDWLFPSRRRKDAPLTTRQCARLVDEWIAASGLPVSRYGAHSLRRAKATLI